MFAEWKENKFKMLENVKCIQAFEKSEKNTNSECHNTVGFVSDLIHREKLASAHVIYTFWKENKHLFTFVLFLYSLFPIQMSDHSLLISFKLKEHSHRGGTTMVVPMIAWHERELSVHILFTSHAFEIVALKKEIKRNKYIKYVMYDIYRKWIGSVV